MSIKDEISAAVATLGLDQQSIVAVPDSEAAALFATFLERFTGGIDARWWWEHFTMPSTWARFSDQQAFTRLCSIVPDPQERVWFVAEDDQLPFYPVYDATPAAIQRLLGECYSFEYYLISKDLSWLLCENHHDTLIALGAAVQERMPKGDS